MANSLYDNGRQGFLDGTLNVVSSTIKCLFTGSGYVPNRATDQHVSDIPSGSILVRSGAFTTKTVTAGVFNADDIVFSALTGAPVFYLVVYADTGTDSTSRLIAVIDTAIGLPFTPNGGNLTIVWDSSGIFKL